MTTALRAILRTHDCGCAEEKRFTLTEGGRVSEGATPRNKRAYRLMIVLVRDDEKHRPINKAVASIKSNPMLTATRLRIAMLYTSSLFVALLLS